MAMSTPMIFASLLGLSIILVFIGLTIPGQPNRVQERLQTYGSRPRSLAEIELDMPFSERVALPMIRAMSNFISRFTPQRNIEDLKRKLEMAGNPNDWTSADFLGVRGLLALVLGILVLVPALLVRLPVLQLIGAVAAGAFLGFELPLFWLNYKINQRKHDIQKALPDALDLLTISVEAGLGFDGAMLKVAEKSDNELSRAFARVNAEIRVGKIRRDALRDMAYRSDVPDVTNFIAAVIQADQLGVSMAKVLRIQSEQMRIKRRQRAEELAAEAPIKMMFPLVFLIFPSILIVLLGPAVIIFVNKGLGVWVRALNRTRQAVLVEEGTTAASIWARMRGLLGHRPLKPGEGLLLRGEKAIHTIGMGFPIDVVFLDRSGRVVHLHHSMVPLRASPFVFRAANVLEMPAGTLARTGTCVGDEIELTL